LFYFFYNYIHISHVTIGGDCGGEKGKFGEGKMKKIILIAAVLVVCGVVDQAVAAEYTAIDLKSSEFRFSWASGISGNQQVGYVMPWYQLYDIHAILWNGSAESYIDLNPSGFTYSRANGISGNQQVGFGLVSATGGNHHALVWSGSAENCIDLHQFLPTGFISSYATGIDSNGNIAGYATDRLSVEHAIVWIVPEPASAILLIVGAGLLRFRKRKR
jgi:uncharacterized membrane protein